MTTVKIKTPKQRLVDSLLKSIDEKTESIFFGTHTNEKKDEPLTWAKVEKMLENLPPPIMDKIFVVDDPKWQFPSYQYKPKKGGVHFLISLKDWEELKIKSEDKTQYQAGSFRFGLPVEFISYVQATAIMKLMLGQWRRQEFITKLKLGTIISKGPMA